MNALAPAVRMAAGAAFLLLLLLPGSAAQVPNPYAGVLAFNVSCPDTMLEPGYAGQDEAVCMLEDLSRDAVFTTPGTGSTSVTPHTVELSVVPLNSSANVSGFQVVLSTTYVGMVGGQTLPFTVNLKATPTINSADYDFALVAKYTHTSGYNQTVITPFHAEVNYYDFATARIPGHAQVQKVGQDARVTYPVEITNVGVYPDSYRITVSTDDDIYVSPPPNVFVPPGETRTVNVQLLTPHAKIYEIGRSTTVNVKVTSLTGSGAYGTVGILQIRGSYIPVYWIPLLLVGIASAAVVTRETRERAALRRLEAGRPRRVQPTPRQAVLLAELRRQDKGAYKQKAGALDSVYKERVSEYRGHRKERAAADREEAKRAHAEYVAMKVRRKEEAEAQRAKAKLDRKEQKRQAKIERKELKQKQKELAKTRKKLEKARKKADKVAAKEAKVQAKLDAKQAKLDAAAAKAAEKEARKAAKAAKKRGEGP